MILLALYLLYLGMAGLLAVTAYRRFLRRGGLWASVASLLTLALFSLFLPIPIHGGFTFPLEIAWSELQHEKWQQDVERHDAKERAFRQQMEQRFAGRLTRYARSGEEGGWQRIQLRDGEAAWLDKQSGLFWLPPRVLQTTQANLSLETATAFCQQQPPQGYWALPSEAELALLWQHDGLQLMPSSGQSGVALLFDTSMQLQLVTRYRGRVAGHALRCVALGNGAPRGGYSSSDIPLTLWNRFQLSKTELYTAGTVPNAASLDQEMK